MKFKYENMTLGQLGQVFGVSSHEAGRWLTEIGLRYETSMGKKPSRRAYAEGFVVDVPSKNQGYMWAWLTLKTVKALQEAGHTIKIPPGHELLAPCVLNGPFECRSSPHSGFEIVNADGSVAVSVIGRKNAELVEKLLNLADQNGFVRRHLGTDEREIVA